MSFLELGAMLLGSVAGALAWRRRGLQSGEPAPLPAELQPWASAHGFASESPLASERASAALEAVMLPRVDTVEAVLVGDTPAGTLTLVQHYDPRGPGGPRNFCVIASLDSKAEVPLLRFDQGTPPPSSVPARKLHDAVREAVSGLHGAMAQLRPGRVSLCVRGPATPPLLTTLRDRIINLDAQLPRMPGRLG